MTSADLYEKARLLDALAADVEDCVDPAKTVASSPDWDCANADDVRSALSHWRGKAHGAARNLRDEAARVRSQAHKAADREEEQREQDARDRRAQ